ncbi:MAG TPA: nickel-binding protein [Dehalococcoidia bacterium]|jgi:hypothetical protein|nr:nickel-binding protein [Dehalococcoidia bacterium]
MPLFLIRRNVPGIGRADVDAAFLRAHSCAYSYEGLRWITSFWNQEEEVIHCVWEARDADQLRDHARRSRIPCDEVSEVIQFSPSEMPGIVQEAASV